MRIVPTLVAVAVAGAIGSLIAAGCGPITSGAEGISCTDQSDCASGYLCLPYFQIGDAGCASIGTSCLQKCATDEDCANLQLGFTCMTACGGTFVCEPPMIFGDAAVAVDASATDAAFVDAQGQ
jgi:hypothetical protein